MPCFHFTLFAIYICASGLFSKSTSWILVLQLVMRNSLLKDFNSAVCHLYFVLLAYFPEVHLFSIWIYLCMGSVLYTSMLMAIRNFMCFLRKSMSCQFFFLLHSAKYS